MHTCARLIVLLLSNSGLNFTNFTFRYIKLDENGVSLPGIYIAVAPPIYTNSWANTYKYSVTLTPNS